MESSNAITALAALAQQTRLRVFRLLVRSGAEGLGAGEIATILKVPANTLSTHLKRLADAGLILGTRSGRTITYTIQWDGMRELVGFLTEDCCAGIPEKSK